jgi:hypothetical protein
VISGFGCSARNPFLRAHPWSKWLTAQILTAVAWIAQAMAAHESPRTTKLYDRTGDQITLAEVERIAI